MPSRVHDVAIVGGGPTGLITANDIAEQGHDVVVLEEHPTIGEPNHCAGLLSVSGLASLGLQPPRDVIQNRVSGARIFSPSGHSVLVERGRREAQVIDRSRFDRWLAERAIDAGAAVLTETKAVGINCPDGETCCLVLQASEEDRTLDSQIVVDAEGTRCQLSKAVGLQAVPRSSKYPAYQYELSGVEMDEDIVEMYYGRHTAPGFFAWIIPLGEKRARVGLAARDRAKVRLEAAMRYHSVMSSRLKHASVERGFGGVVVSGLPLKRTVKGRFLVVGDAAGIVKPTTGGGVIMGGTAARVAGRVISNALSKENLQDTDIQLYESSWRSLLIRELRAMYFTQRVISSLSDRGLDTLIKDAEQFDLVETVRREGDMDLQRRVIFRLLANPFTILAGLRAVRYLSPLF